MQQLLRRCVELGARIAEPGEFTRRAFLNDRLDLAQAESVADLIDASSAEAARSAARSLAGEFSRRIHAIVAALTRVAHARRGVHRFSRGGDRSRGSPRAGAAPVERSASTSPTVLAEAQQGAVLRDGLTVVLIGRPNVGKSSLLNRLAGEDLAIVTPIAGTTRDYVRATVSIEGVPIHLIDTAGLARRGRRDRAHRDRAHLARGRGGGRGAVHLGSELAAKTRRRSDSARGFPQGMPVAHVVNKIDLTGEDAASASEGGDTTLKLSAKTGAGVEALRGWLLEVAGWKPHGEGLFMARERHLRRPARQAGGHLHTAESLQAYELIAEELRLAQLALGRITGEVTADDLLGRDLFPVLHRQVAMFHVERRGPPIPDAVPRGTLGLPGRFP